MKTSKLTWSILGGSFILLITMNLFNVLNLVYNVSMAYLLSLEDYGVLTTLIYLVIIFAVFSESIQTVISKYSTRENDKGKLKNITLKSFKKASFLAIIIYIIFSIIAIPLSRVLDINYFLILLVGLMLFTAFMIPVSRGVLQGRKKFNSLGWNMVSEGFIKLIIAIGLVVIGFGLYGAVLGIILGSVAALALSLLNIRYILKSKEKKAPTPDIYNYTKPVFVVIASVVLFLSLDIIMAKIFFPADLVGEYAIASTIAKILFIGTQPIGKAMFPFTSEAKEPKDSKKALKNSLLIILAIIFFSLIMIYFFSDLIIRLYSGKTLATAAIILFPLSISQGLLALTNLVLFYNLSRGKTKGHYYVFLFVLIQIILLSIFQSNLVEFSFALIVASALFLWGSVMLSQKN